MNRPLKRLTCTSVKSPKLIPTCSVCREAQTGNKIPLWPYCPLKLPDEWRNVSWNEEWLKGKPVLIQVLQTVTTSREKNFNPGVCSDEIPDSVITLALKSTCSFNIKAALLRAVACHAVMLLSVKQVLEFIRQVKGKIVYIAYAMFWCIFQSPFKILQHKIVSRNEALFEEWLFINVVNELIFGGC